LLFLERLAKMLYATNENGDKVRALPGARAVCPVCGGAVTAKCGKIMVWHWAHESVAECDPWSESIGAWHMMWQGIVRPEFCEVVIRPDPSVDWIGSHRADIFGNGGVIVELQASPISVDTIIEREAFYERMIWLFDVRDARERISLSWGQSGVVKFRWRHARKSIANAQAPVFLDDGEHIIEVKKIHNDGGPFAGWGYMLTHAQFIGRFLSTVLQEPTCPS
jgi:hypothetical protein